MTRKVPGRTRTDPARPPREGRGADTLGGTAGPLSLIKRQVYLVALPLTLLAVLLTLALDAGHTGDLFNRVALPLLAGGLLTLTLLLYLRAAPLRALEHAFYLVAVLSFFAKFAALLLSAQPGNADAAVAQVYIWAPFVYILGFLIYDTRGALARSALVYVVSALLGGAVLWGRGAADLGSPVRLTEFYLASALWLGMLYALSDLRRRVAELQLRFGEMERLAHRDPLTGVSNRREIEAQLAARLDGFSRDGMAWSVLLFDIDNFKRINDVYGHETGDRVLREVACRVQHELRGSDFLGRWGGEEFLVLATQTGLPHAHTLAERLRALLAAQPFETVGTVTASFGVATYRQGEDLGPLIERVDAALYRAKREGKNRVAVACPSVGGGPLTLPPLRVPAARVPGVDPEVWRATSAWLEGRGLGPRVPHARDALAASLAGLAAALHPLAPAPVLRPLTDWYCLMFLHDDRCDASGIGRDPGRLRALSARLLHAFGGGTPDEDDEPLAAALADLRRRLLALGGEHWLRELTRHVRAYLDALGWEADNRARGVVPPLEAYRRMRPVTAGLQIDAAFLPVSCGVRLPRAVRDHPAVRALAEAADRAVCWSNDILSLEKERHDGDVHNLVLVLMQARGLDTDAALEEAALMYHEELDGLEAGARALPSFTALGPGVDEEVRRYAELLLARVGGILAWSRQSRRYGPEAEAALS